MSRAPRPDTLCDPETGKLEGEGTGMVIVERVLAAVLLLCLGGSALAQNPSPPAPESVTGLAAWDRLKGNTITGKVSGQPFTEYFDQGGGVKYVDKDGLSTGTWAVQAGRVCFDFPEDDDRSCSAFTVTGTAGSALDDDGMTTRFQIEPGDSKGL